MQFHADFSPSTKKKMVSEYIKVIYWSCVRSKELKIDDSLKYRIDEKYQDVTN